jgi:peptidoglycan/LPS O-acetylase OafA/YrhL
MKNVFRRITSTGHYMPEVDGLRFIAVTSVLLVHAHLWLVRNLGIDDVTRVPGLSTLDPWLMRGGYGVEIFFIISGFILSLPLLRGVDFSYRKYLTRRLTRLEPPYLISLSFIFLAMLYAGKYSFSELGLEMLASMAYLNNLIFPEQLPLVNGVTWSLEIEVQFYLLCPVIGLMLRRNKYQVLYYLGLLLTALVVQKWFEPAFLSLLSVGSYFLLGILLAYVYLRYSPMTGQF